MFKCLFVPIKFTVLKYSWQLFLYLQLWLQWSEFGSRKAKSKLYSYYNNNYNFNLNFNYNIKLIHKHNCKHCSNDIHKHSFDFNNTFNSVYGLKIDKAIYWFAIFFSINFIILDASLVNVNNTVVCSTSPTLKFVDILATIEPNSFFANVTSKVIQLLANFTGADFVTGYWFTKYSNIKNIINSIILSIFLS